MNTITVIGGGISGLTAAIASAEQGADVTLFEAHRTPGGRARSTAAPHVANDGPHVLYCDGAPFSWLAERGLVQPFVRPGLRELSRIRLRHEGRITGRPPSGLLRAAARRRAAAPVDRDFASWGTELFGAEGVRAVSGLLGVVTYDADPGRLSAAFVWERFGRAAAPRYPTARYVVGGWQAMVDRMVERARALGVRVETGTRVDRLPSDGPTIVATSLDAARTLLDDDSLRWESGRSLLVDLGLRSRRGEPYLVFDLDEGGFVGRYSQPDPSLAPAGEDLVQAQMPVRPGESRSDVRARLERLVDAALPGWRDRVTWRRDQMMAGRSGALDLPGRSWRDRPAVDRGDGVYLAGDMVAAPGLLGEVSITSALTAVRAALGRSAARVA
ncbi:FAD-dependent oxidoreductase [Thermobifida halotolerans]|uniref:FAD-dependent oxidoreductase n=1 Tax=Thermobifida halotolerans TaxID=483545 RepID=A0A399G1E5_9ACTN|nr:FAD-dependent oxidoreductase [Thermobifida halotolerans]UOE18401.1 FAD-dependent oxidoreductase [Thermobifida halotolerans]